MFRISEPVIARITIFCSDAWQADSKAAHGGDDRPAHPHDGDRLFVSNEPDDSTDDDTAPHDYAAADAEPESALDA
jgi:hypothetical protein